MTTLAISAQSIDWTSKVREIVADHNGRPEALLDILHDIQGELNYLPPEAMRRVALEMGLPLSKVYGVATFYSMYSTKPRGKYVVRICESAPCHVMGAREVIAALEENAGAKVGETSPDGLFTLEFTSCLGVCGVAPAVMVNDQVHGNLTPESAAAVLDEYRSRERGE